MVGPTVGALVGHKGAKTYDLALVQAFSAEWAAMLRIAWEVAPRKKMAPAGFQVTTPHWWQPLVRVSRSQEPADVTRRLKWAKKQPKIAAKKICTRPLRGRQPHGSACLAGLMC